VITRTELHLKDIKQEGLDSCGSEYDEEICSCEYGNKTWDSIQFGEFLKKLTGC
jgi:hypothetical protein